VTSYLIDYAVYRLACNEAVNFSELLQNRSLVTEHCTGQVFLEGDLFVTELLCDDLILLIDYL